MGDKSGGSLPPTLRVHRLRAIATLNLALLLSLSFSPGCALKNPLLRQERNYPSSWPTIAHLGADCAAVNGRYANMGVFVANEEGDGPPETPLRLTELLSTCEFPDAGTITLTLLTDRVDKQGNSFTTLHVSPDAAGSTQGCEFSTYCIDGDLAFPNARPSSGGMPFVYLDAGQTNLWLTTGQDGSLIVRISAYHAGMVIVVPYFAQRGGWAKFPRVSP